MSNGTEQIEKNGVSHEIVPKPLNILYETKKNPNIFFKSINFLFRLLLAIFSSIKLLYETEKLFDKKLPPYQQVANSNSSKKPLNPTLSKKKKPGKFFMLHYLHAHFLWMWALEKYLEKYLENVEYLVFFVGIMLLATYCNKTLIRPPIIKKCYNRIKNSRIICTSVVLEKE